MRPISEKSLYVLSPFKLDDGTIDIQYWISIRLSNLVSLEDTGYMGSLITYNPTTNNAEIILQFSADKAVRVVRNQYTSATAPSIIPELRVLKNYAFFGEVEENASLATVKRKKKDVEVLHIHCNVPLVVCWLLDQSPSDSAFNIKFGALNNSVYCPEDYGNIYPGRIYVQTSTVHHKFDPDDINNYDNVVTITNRINVKNIIRSDTSMSKKKDNKKTSKKSGEELKGKKSGKPKGDKKKSKANEYRWNSSSDVAKSSRKMPKSFGGFM